jgi:acyl-coenzyme A synthetase/AMP-(fatty) acid ligase
MLDGIPPVLLTLAHEGAAVAAVDSDLRALRGVVLTGESLPTKLVSRWLLHYPQVELFSCSGWGEHVGFVSSLPLHETATSPGKNKIIVRPAFGCSLHVLDRKQSLLPIGVSGDLYVGGARVGRGYLHDAQGTAEAFIPDPFNNESGARLYKTDELACSLPNGDIELAGRREFQIEVRGSLLAPSEIESVLLQYPAIIEAVVVSLAQSRDGYQLVAYVVFDDKQASGAEEVRLFLQGQLPEYLLPTVLVLEKLPRSSDGGIDRLSLPDPPGDPTEAAEAFVFPRTPTEQVVSGIWKEVLGSSRIGVHDKFFEIGGDSLKVLRMYLLLNELYPDALTVVDLFKHNTIEFVSSYLDSAYLNSQSSPAIQSFEI